MTDQDNEPSLVVPILLSLVVLYFVPIIAIAVDEFVFRTYFFSRISPDWVEELISTIYWPVIELVRRMI